VVVNDTARALRTFGGDGREHEGLVYWTGRIVGDSTYVLSAIVPKCQHAPYRVMAAEQSIGEAASLARMSRLGIVAQVHSHPDDDTRHSDGDDQLILMPFEGMFSLVIGSYGHGGMTPDAGAGLHQFQDGEWIRVAPSTGVMVVVPSIKDLRDE
jgi:proteasome lid subunit RPN8/RPN11